MTARRRAVLVSAAVAAAGALTLAGWYVLRPKTSLAEAAALAEARRFDEAEALVREALREDPSRSDAHMLAAQLALDRPEPPVRTGRRPDPKPALEAIEHLKHVRPNDRYLAALAALHRGKAEYRLGRLEQAEASWLEALRIDPTIPEAGWFLLESYYLQGRPEDSRKLALRLHAVEPDPHDRAQYLLELVRQDAQPRAPASIVQWFEPVVEQNPDDLHASLALGSALVQAGEADRGIDVLRRAVKAHPDQAETWNAWLTGLDDAGQIETLEKVVDRLPPEFAGLPRFAKHKARIFQERGDWKSAAADYRRALEAEPHDHRLEYRLSRALRNAGDTSEADRFDRRHRSYTAATEEVRALYEQANAIKTLGVRPHPDLYRRLAENRERLGLKEEARAWYHLALRDGADPAVSEALERLKP
jgi:tetratricopeptide (TPR) repeat protein